jgi:hypothetical protein
MGLWSPAQRPQPKRRNHPDASASQPSLTTSGRFAPQKLRDRLAPLTAKATSRMRTTVARRRVTTVRLAAARFSAARKALLAVRHGRRALGRWGRGVNLLGAFFKIPGRLRRRPARTQPQLRRVQARPTRQPLQGVFWRCHLVERTSARFPPPIRPLRASNADFCGQAWCSL